MRPLGVLGNVNVDLILGPTAPWPQPGTEVMVAHDDLRVGGAAGNTALAWQALGVPFAIFASVGSDMFGRWLAEAFGERATGWPAAGSATTVSVGITHPGGERTFFTSRGHLPLFGWADLQPMLEQSALSGGILLVCGSFLMDGLAADYPALFDWADANDVEIALDTGWPVEGWTEPVRARTMEWLPRCRYLLLNEIETTKLAGAPDVTDAAQGLLPRLHPDGVVVTKLGPRGAAAHGAGGTIERARAPKVDVIDTIGAGDVFNAGFLMNIAAGRALAQALAAGTQLASLAVSTSPRRYVLEDPT
ncbi:carbohydrate kinase family protein [Jiella sp. M17.18]|uniref:carbohydrate kinase family protein n=1 Tax=Jiella sp. M17.18 TaxID=3234247 RepID=UPI0034DFC0E4